MNDKDELGIEEGKSILASRNDNFLVGFGREYQKLLSHRRTLGDINPEKLRDALFEKRIRPEQYAAYDDKLRGYAEEILTNMKRRLRLLRRERPRYVSSSRCARRSSTSKRSSASDLCRSHTPRRLSPPASR